MRMLRTALFAALASSFTVPAALASEANGTVVAGTGHGFYYGTVALSVQRDEDGRYVLIDNSRDGNRTSDAEGADTYLSWYMPRQQYPAATPVFGDGSLANPASHAADAHYAYSKSWDYFHSRHGRRGIDDSENGRDQYLNVTFRSSGIGGYENVEAWAWSSMLFLGKGEPAAGILPLTTLDLVGRAFSAAVVEQVIGGDMPYNGESAGLLQSTADVFGAMIEFYAANPRDAGDYVIGELAFPAGLRHMYKQSLDGSSYSCYPLGGFASDPDAEYSDAHQISGVGNRAFYLLAEGAKVPGGSGLALRDLVCNGDTRIVGIGRDKAAKIWYRALTQSFNSATTYADARRATIAAAEALYGAGSRECAAVWRAWAAAGVN